MTRVKSINSKLTYNGYLYASDSKEHYKQGKLVKVLVDEKAWYEQNLYHTNRPVMMFDVNDYEYKNPLMKFDSIAEANEYFKDTGLSGGRGAISNACSGRAKTSYGYRWRYQN